jgi:hypothetical protein
MKQDLFAWLKDRKVFTSGGHKTLTEYLNAREEVELHKNDIRFGRRQKTNNKRNTRGKI